MTNQEIDRLMAEKVMGWQRWSDSNGVAWWDGGLLVKVADYHPSENIAQAMEAEEEFAKQLRITDYIQALAKEILTPYQLEDLDWKNTECWQVYVWRFTHATPLQRCLAILETKGVEVKE
jgi:hypothetical protein